MTLPERPNLEHLKKQAKELLRSFESGAPDALARFRASLPAAAKQDDAALSAMALRLHDAQSCVAREHGFASWADLKAEVEWRHAQADEKARLLYWLTLVYAGRLIPGGVAPRPHLALRFFETSSGLVGSDPYLACAVCDETAVARTIASDPAWVNRPSPSFQLPPLVALTASSIAGLPEVQPRAHRCLRLLLDAGADPNQFWTGHYGPLRALYGAAGCNHDPEMTRMLLAAGADPNDGESLYHSVESRDLTCTRLLLEGGARVEGSNVLGHLLDREDRDGLRLILPYAKGIDDPTLLWAIRRRRSAETIQLLLDAGANPRARSKDGLSAYAMALRYGLPEVAQFIAAAGAAEEISEEDRFVAACARADREEARRIQVRRPDLPGALSAAQLKQLPELAEAGHNAGVELMVELGWPLDIRGGDWGGTALNMAVFHGNVPLVRFLLDHGGSWTEGHNFGDNVCGTLSHSSCNNDPEHDWLAIAKLLVEHGMPGALPIEDAADPRRAECVRIDGKIKRFSEEVTEYLLSVGRRE